MLSQKIPRTWQIYLLLTYHPNLLEASVSNLPDPHVEVVVEEGLQPLLHQQELPYFNPLTRLVIVLQQVCKTCFAEIRFRVFLSIHEYSRSRRGLPGNSCPPATWCVSLNKQTGFVLHFPPSPWCVATNTLALERELLVLIFVCGWKQ